MFEKDPRALSAIVKAEILKNVEVTVLRRSATLRFVPENIEIVREALQKGGFTVGRTQAYNG